MPSDPRLTLDDLAELRRQLVEDVRPHRASVNYFAGAAGFVRTAKDAVEFDTADPPPISQLVEGTQAKGITTALTCFESLNEAILDSGESDPGKFSGLTSADRSRLSQFCENALADTSAWRSEFSARRYCIVRALPPLVQLHPKEDRTKEIDLIREVWDRVALKPENCGVFEVAPNGQDNDPEPLTAYPPNAFLTYWALKGLPWCFRGRVEGSSAGQGWAVAAA